MERPQNLHEARMQQLIAKRFALKAELAAVDEQIGKLDLQMSRAPKYDMNFERLDLDADAMYSPTKRIEQATKPPYPQLLQ